MWDSCLCDFRVGNMSQSVGLDWIGGWFGGWFGRDLGGQAGLKGLILL